ncbi:beta-ketoacyl-[acyl-carrier-protein] synthase family protein [Kitasatospora sp. NPDC127121]|uniref:beta-ketoacyl-[acyl-carrier-protein] synthase family protein n=1 Tax=Kitasatospora sp. NPDC127121 TaxID=3345371 RepID=UPI0036293AA3
MNRPEIAVTGLGLVTPAGFGTEETWQRVCAGTPTASPDPDLDAAPVTFSCRIPAMDLDTAVGRKKAWRIGRFSKLALLAAREAVQNAGLDTGGWDGARVAVVLGVGFGGAPHWEDQLRRLHQRGPAHVSPTVIPMVIGNMAVGEVAQEFGARGPTLACATACASGATALAIAHDLLVAGSCDIVLAGGAEAALSPLVATGFHRMGTLSARGHDVPGASRPFAADRDGFVLAEGAAVLVLERAADARARGARARAVLAGHGASNDAHHPTAPPQGAAGAEQALRTALRSAGLGAGDIGHVNAHGTSTPLNDAAEAGLIARALPHQPSVTAPKGVLGHSLGAAGAIEAALTVLTIERGLVPPIANLTPDIAEFDIDCVTGTARRQRIDAALSHSFGFGGHNVVLALRRD